MNTPRLAIVIPCYNEQQALSHTLDHLAALLSDLAAEGKVATDSYICCVDDGSTDATWQIISDYHSRDNRIHGLRLAANSGQQNALMAGLMEVRGNCDIAVSLDADMQDDPTAIGSMIECYNDGAETVYAVRSARPHDTLTKRITARGFYSLRKLIDKETIPDHSDFRLLSAATLDRLADYDERNLYLRGIIPQIGGRQAFVTYERGRRIAGKSKYEGRRMLHLALDGITSFSTRPIKAIFFIGLLIMLVDIAVAAYVFASYFGGDSIPGWTSMMLSIWFLGSLVLMAIGIVGAYVGKIFIEVKRRPRYHITTRL